MKSLIRYLLIAGFIVAAPSTHAVILISQNFDTDPVNYTSSDFVRLGTAPGTGSKYWNLSSNIADIINPNITGNATTYLTGQNMDAALPFSTDAPAFLEFAQNAVGFSGLSLSFDMAGLLSPETANYVRAMTDDDGDLFYENILFFFQGGSLGDNTPYVDIGPNQLGQLNPTFATFTVPVANPISPDGVFRLRFELYNDTDSQNEATAIDNIVVNAVIPEPGTSLLLLAGLVAFGQRRRRI